VVKKQPKTEKKGRENQCFAARVGGTRGRGGGGSSSFQKDAQAIRIYTVEKQKSEEAGTLRRQMRGEEKSVGVRGNQRKTLPWDMSDKPLSNGDQTTGVGNKLPSRRGKAYSQKRGIKNRIRNEEA